MHSRPARHKTLPQKQKCIWERRIWQKKLQKEKIHAKIQAVGRTAAETGFGSFLRAAAFQKPVRRHFSYPMEYEAEVRRACEKYDLDPCLVFAVIRTESFFTPDAVSGAGAQGLMQIMPETGEWIAWRQGKEYDESRIFEPDYNIDLGCWLLSFLLEKYNGDVELAAAAYNAGHSAVNRWLDDPKYYDGKNLTIPYEETENYVKKVKDAYEKYQFLRESEHEAGRE